MEIPNQLIDKRRTICKAVNKTGFKIETPRDFYPAKLSGARLKRPIVSAIIDGGILAFDISWADAERLYSGEENTILCSGDFTIKKTQGLNLDSRKLKFETLRKALKVYDAGAENRTRKWKNACTSDDVSDCRKMDREARELVGTALYMDTTDFNTLEACKLVNPDGDWLRNLVKTK